MTSKAAQEYLDAVARVPQMDDDEFVSLGSHFEHLTRDRAAPTDAPPPVQ